MQKIGNKDFWDGDQFSDYPTSNGTIFVVYLLVMGLVVIANMVLMPFALKYVAMRFALPPYVDEV